MSGGSDSPNRSRHPAGEGSDEARRPRRLALFIPDFSGGGAEGIMLQLARGFAARGYPVDLVVVRNAGPLRESLDKRVNLIDLGTRRVLYSVPRLIRYLRRERPHAMLATLPHANFVAVIAARLARTQTRVVIRQASTASSEFATGSLPARWAHYLLMRLIYPRADVIVGVSKGACADLVELLGVPPGRIKLTYNPVISPQLWQAAREELAHPWFAAGACPVIVAIGRLSKEKDFATLIRAFKRVRDSTPARLMILGEGGERGALEDLAAELDVAGEVALPGFVDNPFPFLARANVFVLSSIFEGLPGALIQALALGVPVVATDCPSGPDEILAGGRYGRLVEVGDELALAGEISALLGRGLSAVERPPESHIRRFDFDASLDAYLEHLLPAVALPVSGGAM